MDLDVSVLIGSAAADLNNRCTFTGGDRFFIAETCEYRRHFLSFSPTVMILTSVEEDHPDYFKNFDDIKIGTWFIDYNDFEEEMKAYEKIFEENLVSSGELNRNPDNVTIKVDESTVSVASVSITITDNNENHYGWGVEFRVQQKIDDKWEDLQYISDDLTWIEIAYELNEDNQLTQKLDIEKYYGKLSNGIYRIVKPVYDNGYIDIYSNEFEIK